MRGLILSTLHVQPSNYAFERLTTNAGVRPARLLFRAARALEALAAGRSTRALYLRDL
jgi:hypothetical protein